MAGAVVTGVLVAPVAARADYQPSDADFASCPALPADAVKLFWNCVSVNLDKGRFKLGALDQTLTESIPITVAVGFVDGKLTTISSGLGGGSSSSFGIDVPLIGTISVSIEPVGSVGGGGLIPTSLPFKIHLSHWLLGSGCYIGTDAAPIVIKPQITNPRIEFSGWNGILRADVSDTTFAVPGATGCGLGGLFNGAVNAAAGTPSASGSNSLKFDAHVRLRNYQLGTITPSLGMLANAAPAT
ncbi:hypothetical protein [Actinocorallia longicatena]|uniref:hypothetical protein n=1 Tax=Actinocorallia longicatena TaxID=111803 RepID=UPI0031D86BEA